MDVKTQLDVKNAHSNLHISHKLVIIIGPRYTWGPIYGSKCLSVSNWVTLVDLTDVSLVDEDTNSIQADDTNRAIPDNLEIQVRKVVKWEKVV